MSKSISYAVITPVRNEGQHLPLTISSMAAQSIRPTQWVIVNDGSSDNTGEIAEAAARTYPWIRVITRADRGFRKAGGGVVDAFYEGYRVVEKQRWDFVVKLDGDLSFGPDYFETCFGEFERDPHLGIVGGTISSNLNGVVRSERPSDPRFHVRGATKIYRRACWEAIGGLLVGPGWDTLDEVKANMLGWGTCTIAALPIIHHRPTGAAYGTWKDRVKNGLGCYITGYHPLFMLLKSLQRMAQKPYLVGGCGLLFGFISGYIKRVPQVEDKAVVRYFRQQQLNRLLLRKSLWS